MYEYITSSPYSWSLYCEIKVTEFFWIVFLVKIFLQNPNARIQDTIEFGMIKYLGLISNVRMLECIV